jgi:ribonuclease HI
MIIYYTDGSTAPTNPGPGGYAVIKDMQPHILDSEPGTTTNIRMEGLAIIAALRDARGAECEIRTDSKFWIDVLTVWIVNWRKKKFKDVKNLDIVTEIDRLYQKSPKCKLVHVRGHKGEPGNEMADEYANKARTGEIMRPDGVRLGL